MRWSTLLAVVVIIALIQDSSSAKGKKKKKGGKKGGKGKKGKRPTVGVNSEFGLYTEPGAPTCPCWWDMSRNDCGCCKFGAIQCGFPKHKFCYKPSRFGCPGIKENIYTLSQIGHPCHYDHSDRSCAWCAEGGFQCEKGKQVCYNGKDQRYCESMIPDCGHIGADICDVNAECVVNRKVGDATLYKCLCNEGWTGNGIECIDVNTGEFSEDPNAIVEVEITLEDEFMIEDPVDGEFPNSAGVEGVMSAVKSMMDAGSTGCSSCEAALANITAPTDLS